MSGVSGVSGAVPGDRPEDGARDATGARRWSAPGRDARVSRPQRPELSDRTPPPVTGKDAVPLALRRAQSLWYVAAALLLFSCVVMIMVRINLANYLTGQLKSEDSSISNAELADAAPLIVYTAIVILVLVAVPVAGFARLLTHRRAWPRIVMIPMALVHAAVAFLVVLIIPLANWQGWMLLGALTVSGLLALVAGVRAFGPSASAWLRDRWQDDPVEPDGPPTVQDAR